MIKTFVIITTVFGLSFFYHYRKERKKHTVKSPVQIELTATEKSWLDSLGIDHEVGLKIVQETSNPLERLELQKLMDGGEPEFRGVKSIIDKSKRIDATKRLQKALDTKVYQLFACGGYAGHDHYYVAVLKSNDKYEPFRVQETNGVNHDVYTEDIIAFLQKWEKEANFNVVEVEADLFTIEFENLDFNLDEFCEETIKFCPDFLTALEDADELKRNIKGRKSIQFWWD